MSHESGTIVSAPLTIHAGIDPYESEGLLLVEPWTSLVEAFSKRTLKTEWIGRLSIPPLKSIYCFRKLRRRTQLG
jgi:hypothetical protein